MKNTNRCGLGACAIIGSLVWAIGTVSAQEGSAQQDPAASEPASVVASKSFRLAVENSATLAGGLSVQLNKSFLREGDALVVTVDVPRDGYLYLVSVGPDDVATVLFPNQSQRDNEVSVGQVTIPSEQMKFDLKVTKPHGATVVAAFLSKEALDVYESGGGERDAQGAMQEAFARLSVGSLRQIEKLAAKSFRVERQAAPLLGGLAHALVCAPSGPCEIARVVTAAGDFPSEARLTPGILLEPPLDVSLPKGVRLRPVPDKGIALAKVSEGFVPRLYNDGSRFCSIGYGHMVKKAPCDTNEPVALRRGVSELQGAVLLVEDMRRAQRAVLGLVKTDLTDGQYAALCDFTYNVGARKLQNSTLLKAINAGEHERVPAQLRRWTLADGKDYRGLKTRREREIGLYFEGQPIPKAPPGDDEITPIDIRVGE